MHKPLETAEHFSNPREEFKTLSLLLNSEEECSVLCIMTTLITEKQRLIKEKDFEEWYYRRDPSHCFFYSKKTMEYIADHLLEKKFRCLPIAPNVTFFTPNSKG